MKTALITGATGAIGSETCRILANDGYNIIIHYNKSHNKCEDLLKTLKTFDVKTVSIFSDLNDFDQTDIVISQAINEFDAVDLLVNCAGISFSGLFNLMSVQKMIDVLNTNLLSVLNVSRLVLPYMINKKSGSIINISSMWGEVGASCEVVYSTAKAGVIGFTKALAKEVGPSNIRVNCITPGLIDSQMNKNLSDEDICSLVDDTPLIRIGNPRDVANAVQFLASDRASFITGEVLKVNGGFVI